ncbi:reverse transcriptase [Thalictrum thalictroides]|uniref:Reverse transcriptase n=1 Tax=Thalictrum thalictroides TaxID=46969 RepID=A0A7J6VHG7_THATH|nr:reverse transcriptase [Thalictrum thalictroides]
MIPDELLLELLLASHAQWNENLIVTLLSGENINANHVMKAIRATWRTRAQLDILKRGNNLYVCRFSRGQDKDRIEEEQPWKVLGKLLLIQPFSVDTDPFVVRFNTVPVWISFQNLPFEHHNPDIVEIVAGAAGETLEVLPKKVIPRSSEGYRARIAVKVFSPLVQGTPVKTVNRGNIWVGFNYHKLSNLFCNTCFRLGHDSDNCPFPPDVVQQDNIMFLEYPLDNIPYDMQPNRAVIPQDASFIPVPPNKPEETYVNLIPRAITDEFFEDSQPVVKMTELGGRGPHVTHLHNTLHQGMFPPVPTSMTVQQNLLVHSIFAKLGYNYVTHEAERSGSNTNSTTVPNLEPNSVLEFPTTDLGLAYNVGPIGPHEISNDIVDRGSHAQTGIQIEEPEVTAVILHRRRRCNILAAKKGNIKIPYQMEEQARAHKKRKSEEVNLIPYGATHGDELPESNLKEIAAMWENAIAGAFLK